MAAATSVSATKGGNRRQFQAVFSKVWGVKGTIDTSSLIDAAGETNTVTMTVATGGQDIALGDTILAWSCSVSLNGLTVTPYVSAAGVISLRVQNESAGTVDLASAVFKFVVARIDTAFLP
jgi:hypothetical protein